MQPQPSINCDLHDGTSVDLALTTHYKHLGTIFTEDHGLDLEINQRIGMAVAAFQQMSRAIFTNKHLPQDLRLRLFRALICSKMFFGLGAWTTPTGRQLTKMRGALARMVAKILHLGPKHGKTHFQLLLDADIGDVRARLAIDRLSYAQQLFQAGPAFLHHLVHMEFAAHQNSWLHGLFADLHWLSELDSRIPSTWSHDLSDAMEYWQSGARGWKSQLKRAWKHHNRQEQMMTRVRHLHDSIFRLLQQHGASFSPDPLTHSQIAAEHVCDHFRGLLQRRRVLVPTGAKPTPSMRQNIR